MSKSLQQHSEQPAVLCDMCTEEDRKPARKTCMKCEISMCVQHLQAHLTTPVLLQTHPLTEPLALGEAGATKCPQHGKVLEYYCLDDLTCVCVSCAIEDQHRLHNMKTISTAHKELMEKLGAEQQALATTAGKGESLEKWEKGERRKLAQSSVRLVEAVSKMRDLALSSVQSSVSARMVYIKTSESSIQAAQSEKDTFRFLRMFSGVHQDVEKAKAVDLRKGLEAGSDRDKLVQELRQDGDEMVQKAFQLWGSLLILVDPENHREDFSTSEEVTFDPKSLRKGMSLSSDHRKAFYSRETYVNRPAHTLLIQSDKSNTNWMIRLPEDCDWTIGVCDKVSAKNLKDGHVYGLCCIGDQLSSLTTDDYEVFSATPNDEVDDEDACTFRPQIQTSEKKRRVSSQVIKDVGERGDEETSQPQQVEVLWNVPASSLSFFNRSAPHQRTEILTITTINASWDLSPFVNLGEGEASEEIVNLNQPQIVNLNQPQESQQQCECLCGKVYRKNGNSYSCSYRGGVNRESIWNTCTSCSGVVGEPPITEVLCELL